MRIPRLFSSARRTASSAVNFLTCGACAAGVGWPCACAVNRPCAETDSAVPEAANRATASNTRSTVVRINPTPDVIGDGSYDDAASSDVLLCRQIARIAKGILADDERRRR